MAARKSRRIANNTTRRRRKGAAQPWYVRALAAKWFLNTVFVLMLLGVVALLVQQIWSKAHDSATFSVKAWQWNAEIPPWIRLTKADITKRLSQDEFLTRRNSIFDENLEKNIAARYESLPYVRKVTLIQKRYPNSLHVEVEWRMPVAKVRYAGGEHLIDGDGVVLEPVYDESKLDYTLPLIVGFSSSAPVPVPGKPWPVDDIAIAAKTVRFLQPLFKDLCRMEKDQQVDPVTAIDLRNFGEPRKSRILLLTAGGKVIEWGNPAGMESSNEPHPDRKLANLQKLYAASPTLTSYKDQPLKTWIALQWFENEIVTSDHE
jgi:hypothetical protein